MDVVRQFCYCPALNKPVFGKVVIVVVYSSRAAGLNKNSEGSIPASSPTRL